MKDRHQPGRTERNLRWPRSATLRFLGLLSQGEPEEVELEEGGDLFDEEAPTRKHKKKKSGKKRKTVEEEQEEEEELEPEEVAGLQVGAKTLKRVSGTCGCSYDKAHCKA